MSGLYFESGVDKGFEDDLKKMSVLIDEFAKKVEKAGGQVDSSFKDSGKTAKKAGGYFADMGKQMLAFGAASAVVAGAFQVLKEGLKTIVDFDKALKSLSSITGAVGDDLKFLKDSAVQMSAQYGKSATEIVDAFKLVGSQRPDLLKNAQALQLVTDQVMILSDATGMDLVQSSSAVTAVMSQFGLAAKDTSRIINVLAAGSLEGAAEVDNITESLKNYGTVAKDANLSIEQTVAMIEVLAEKQLFGAEAGTKLRGATLKLKEANLGYASGAFNMRDAMVETNKVLETLGTEAEKDAYKIKLFGLENITAGSILLQNIDKYDKLTKAVTDTNVATEQAAKMNDTLSKDIQKAGTSWDNFILSIESGDGVISKVIRGAVVMFTDLFNVLSKLNTQGAEAAYLDKLKKDSGYSEQVEKQWLKINNAITSTNSAQEANMVIAKENLRIQKEIAGWKIKQADPNLSGAERAELQFNIDAYTELQKRLKDYNKEELVSIMNKKNKTQYLREISKLERKLPSASPEETKEINDKIKMYEHLIKQIENYTIVKDKIEKESKKTPLTEEEEKALKKAYEKSIQDLQQYLSDQRQMYEEYNRGIEGLTGERKDVVKNEYADLIAEGETYLKFLEKLLLKETDLKKQSIIKKEITSVTQEVTINKAQGEQKRIDEQALELEKLKTLYADYEQKKLDIQKQYSRQAEELRSQGLYEQANESDKALEKELERLDDAVIAGDSVYQKWLKDSLPQIAKDGVKALQDELNKLTIALSAEGLDPEQVIIYKAQIEELQKQLALLNNPIKNAETTWKDTLEIMNGVNSLVGTMIDSFDGLDFATKNILTSIAEISSGVINLISGFKALSTAVSSLEKASIVLAIISTALQILTAVVRAFKRAAEERQKLQLIELENIQAINLALIDQNALYAEGNTYFGDDKWGKALAGLKAYNTALAAQQDIYKSMAAKGGSRTVKSGAYNLAEALGNVDIRTRDRSKLANMVGIEDEYANLLDMYPQVIDENGRLNKKLLETIISTADLTELDKTRLSNLIEMTDKAEQVYAQFGDYITSIFGSVGDEVTMAFQNMYTTGADAMSALGESFSDMIEQFTRDAIEFAFLQPYLNQLNETTKALGTKYAAGEINVEELQTGVIETLGSFYSSLKEIQPAILDAYKQADALAAGAGFDAAFNAEATTKEPVPVEDVNTPLSQGGSIVQTITEETGTVLAGRLGALMLSSEKIALQGQQALDYAVQNLLYMQAIRENTDYLPEIAANTKRTYEKLEAI